MDPEDLAEEQAIDWDEPLVVFGRPHEEVVERSSIASPDELDLTLPIVILDDSDKIVDAGQGYQIFFLYNISFYKNILISILPGKLKKPFPPHKVMFSGTILRF